MRFFEGKNVYGIKKQLFHRSLKAGSLLIAAYFSIYWGAAFIIDLRAPAMERPTLNHDLKDIAVVADMLICFASYVFLIIRFIKQKLHDIVSLMDCVHSIENENFGDPIRVSDNDELSLLALRLDRLRLKLARNKLEFERRGKKQAELLTSISHDIRTPLTSLIGYLEIMAENGPEKKDAAGRYVALCLKRAQQLRYLVDTAFEHFYLSDKELEKVELLRCNSIRDLFAILRDRARILEQNGFACDFDLADRHYAIVYDARLMERLFDNIFTNVVRYARRESTVTVRAAITEQGLRIAIGNLVDRQRKSNTSTGVGIKNCRQIMKLHHGSFKTAAERSRFTTELVLPVRNHAPTERKGRSAPVQQK